MNQRPACHDNSKLAKSSAHKSFFTCLEGFKSAKHSDVMKQSLVVIKSKYPRCPRPYLYSQSGQDPAHLSRRLKFEITDTLTLHTVRAQSVNACQMRHTCLITAVVLDSSVAVIGLSIGSILVSWMKRHTIACHHVVGL